MSVECLRENTEKNITFSVPTEKPENGNTLKHKIMIVLTL